MEVPFSDGWMFAGEDFKVTVSLSLVPYTVTECESFLKYAHRNDSLAER